MDMRIHAYSREAEPFGQNEIGRFAADPFHRHKRIDIIRDPTIESLNNITADLEDIARLGPVKPYRINFSFDLPCR